MPFMTEELWAQTAGEGERAADSALPCGMAVAGLRGRRRGRRDQLAGRSCLRHPFGALGDERAAGRAWRRWSWSAQVKRPDAGSSATSRRSAAWRGSSGISFAAGRAEGVGSDRRRRSDGCMPLGSLIDLEAEAARLQREVAKVTEEIARIARSSPTKDSSPTPRKKWSRPSAKNSPSTSEAQERLQCRPGAGANDGRVSGIGRFFREFARAGRADPMRGRRDSTAGQGGDRPKHFRPHCCRNVTAAARR